MTPPRDPPHACPSTEACVGLVRIEGKIDGLGDRLKTLERIVFGGCAAVLLAVVGAMVALVIKTG